MPDRTAKFASVRNDERVFQGEIFVSLIQVHQSLETIGTGDRTLDEIIHPYSIVVTQDCDLESDHRIRSSGASSGSALLQNILFCMMIETSALKGEKKKDGNTAWQQIINNKNERYQCIERVPPELDAKSEGLPSLAADFKQYFSVPADEVYLRIKLQQVHRRCHLATPWAEHFLSRFCYFQLRFALPEEHDLSLE